MCEWCNAQDLDRQAAFETLQAYKGMAVNEMVPKADAYEHFSRIYRSGEMAAFALDRIEKAAGCGGGLWVPAKSVASELELLLSCVGRAGNILDG
ncbi:MAG TPA: hypothetical protein HA362_07955 [Nanoarchaeota archaeon]|nr:hypothetical protein [Nanoarchaeota archaeon]